jgi:dihydroxyacetone kinase-like protein
MGGLTLQQTVQLFIKVADDVIANQELLTEADRAIGDSDHGVGMARGFNAVKEELANSVASDLGALLNAIGTKLMMSIGGAAGAIYGTFFRSGGENLAGVQVLDSAALHRMLADGMAGVQARGKAQPGDKTIIDVLAPAVEKAADMQTAELVEALEAVMESAYEGMESTKTMVATVGRAKTLGERSLGHPDPGAVSMYLILKSMSEHAGKMLDREG